MPDLRPALFAVYSFTNRRGWLRGPLAKWVFRESYFLFKRYYEDPFWRLVKQHPALFQGGHVLDVGANIGYTAYCFARAVDPDCFVYAFEPERVNYAELERLARRPSLAGRIKPVMKAVGREPGELKLWINADHHADHRIVTAALETSLKNHEPAGALDTRRVEVVRLDDFAREQSISDRIRFVKIDVQGYELPVCEGMTGILDRNPDVCVTVEYSPEHFAASGFESEQLLQFFRERRFNAHVVGRRGHSVLRQWDWSTLEPEGYMDILFSRGSLPG